MAVQLFGKNIVTPFFGYVKKNQTNLGKKGCEKVTNRGMEIKRKLLELNKTQNELCEEICKRGVSIKPSHLSKALRSPTYPRDFLIASMAYEICIDWEKAAKPKKGG